MKVLVAKQQRQVGFRSLEPGHLEVLRVDGWWVAMPMNNIARPGGGASWSFDHMIHVERQRRKFSNKGELEERSRGGQRAAAAGINNQSITHLEGFCRHFTRLRPHSRNLHRHWSTACCIDDASVWSIHH